MPRNPDTAKKNIIFYLLLPAALLTAFIMILFGTDNKVNKSNIEYIRSFGWEVEEMCTDITYITIPEEFDSIFSAYNDIVSRGGYDLSPYKGNRAVRYSYIVLNYPSAQYKSVRINILLCHGKIVAADISSYGSNGFVEPLDQKAD